MPRESLLFAACAVLKCSRRRIGSKLAVNKGPACKPPTDCSGSAWVQRVAARVHLTSVKSLGNRMKHLFILLALWPTLGGFAATASARTQPTYSDLGRVTVQALNVRGGPGRKFQPIAVLAVGTTVRILDGQGGWYRITAQGVKGWVSSGFVQRQLSVQANHRHNLLRFGIGRHDSARFGVGNRAPISAQPHRHTRPAHSHRFNSRRDFAVISPNRFGFANVFEQPGRFGRILAQLVQGERVRVLERGRRWTLIRKRGIGVGYIRTRFLDRA